VKFNEGVVCEMTRKALAERMEALEFDPGYVDRDGNSDRFIVKIPKNHPTHRPRSIATLFFWGGGNVNFDPALRATVQNGLHQDSGTIKLNCADPKFMEKLVSLILERVNGYPNRSEQRALEEAEGAQLQTSVDLLNYRPDSS
jgi:hypothetical protein